MILLKISKKSSTKEKYTFTFFPNEKYTLFRPRKKVYFFSGRELKYTFFLGSKIFHGPDAPWSPGRCTELGVPATLFPH